MDKLHFIRRENGQTMAEYSTVLTIITIACLSALALLSGSVINAITRVGSLFS